MKRSGHQTLYTCLKDVTEYIPKEKQIEVTKRIVSYWMGHGGLPLLFIGGDWAGSKEASKLRPILRAKSLKEGRDFSLLPVNMTRYLGDVDDDDFARISRGEAGNPVEEGEYRIISTHPAAVRRYVPQRRFSRTIFVEDWGDSYTSAFGFYKWAAEAYEDGFLNTESFATLFINDLREASQYAIVRGMPEDGVRYPDVAAMMEKKAPKLLKHLREKKFTGLIEESPEADLAFDLTRERPVAQQSGRGVSPRTRRTLEFIGRWRPEETTSKVGRR